MPYDFSKHGFDPQDFLKSLMRKMGLDASAQADTLRSLIEKQMMDVILNTASVYLEPEAIDFITEKYQDTKDPILFIRKLIEYSPETQLQIMDALDEFYDQTLKAYNTLCHPQT